MKNTFHHSQKEFKISFLWDLPLKGLAKLANLTEDLYDVGK